MSDQPRITLRDIAREAGVHYSTVSLALRQAPGVSPQTIERVREVAERLGYVPDPLLAALTSYRHREGVAPVQAAVGYLQFLPEDNPVYRRYRQGAEAALQAQGYRLERFDAEPWDEQAPRLARMLRARGIRGLLLGPQPEPRSLRGFPWDEFRAVALGHGVIEPALPGASNFQYDTMRRLVARLRGLGYRRIGLHHPREFDRRVAHQWTAAFLGAAAEWPQDERVPVSLTSRQHSGDDLIAWVRRERPDCVITSEAGHVKRLHDEGLDVPADLGVACECTSPDTPWLSGMNQNDAEVGAAAADLVATLLRRRDSGAGHAARRVLIPSVWQEGETVRPREGRRAAAA